MVIPPLVGIWDPYNRYKPLRNWFDDHLLFFGKFHGSLDSKHIFKFQWVNASVEKKSPEIQEKSTND